MLCQSMITYIPRAVHQFTAESSNCIYFAGVLSLHATGCTGMRTSIVPRPLTFSKCFLFQYPWCSILSGSEIDNPLNRIVSPFAFTNLFLYTWISGNCLACGLCLGGGGLLSFHQARNFVLLVSCAFSIVAIKMTINRSTGFFIKYIMYFLSFDVFHKTIILLLNTTPLVVLFFTPGCPPPMLMVSFPLG